MTYLQIQQEVADNLNRADLTTQIKTWINRIMKNLENRFNFHYMVNTTTALVIASSTSSVAVPTGLKSVISWFVVDNDTKVFLKPLSEGSMETVDFDYTPSNGRPRYYNREGNTFYIVPTADNTYTNKMKYYKRTDALSVDGDTNYLTDNYPELLVYGACLQAQTVTADTEMIAIWQGMYDNALASLFSEDNISRLINTDIGG